MIPVQLLYKGHEVPLTVNEALSGIFGSISLVAWIVVLVPQLYENYRSSSAEAISLAFLCVWFVGDLTNLVGALGAGLVPTVIALAIYFCFADTILIVQCLYYNNLNARLRARQASVVDNAEPIDPEHEPLLSRRTSIQSNGSIGLPGSHRRDRTRSGGTLTKIPETNGYPRGRLDSDAIAEADEDAPPADQKRTKYAETLRNIGAIFGVCAMGTLGWVTVWQLGIWKPAPLPIPVGEGMDIADDTPLGAEILGYASALAYLGARLPQIFKNWRDKSCAGLSLLFFLLSLLGNLTYGAGILCHSLDRQYVVTNLPWLIGSLGTMFEDVAIFFQFHLYGDKSEDEAVI